MSYQAELISQMLKISNAAIASENASSNEILFAENIKDKHPAIGVYANNYVETGIRALSISYPTLKGLLDEHSFRTLAAGYLSAYPKNTFDWAEYGSGFSDFLLQQNQVSDAVYLPEIALLDWHIASIERLKNKAFVPESFAKLQSEDLSTLRFELGVGFQMIEVFFPVYELYQLVHEPSLQSGPQREAYLSSINKLINDAISSRKTRSIILWRERYKGIFEYCQADTINAYKMMSDGRSIEDVFACFEDEVRLSTFLQECIQTKKIVSVTRSIEPNSF